MSSIRQPFLEKKASDSSMVSVDISTQPSVAAVGLFRVAQIAADASLTRADIEAAITIIDNCKDIVALQSQRRRPNPLTTFVGMAATLIIGTALAGLGVGLLATENANSSSDDHSVATGMVVIGSVADSVALLACCMLGYDERQRGRAALILTTDYMDDYLNEMSAKNKQKVMRVADAIGADIASPVTFKTFRDQLVNYQNQYFPAAASLTN
jgi:hypothetical protein